MRPFGALKAKEVQGAVKAPPAAEPPSEVTASLLSALDPLIEFYRENVRREVRAAPDALTPWFSAGIAVVWAIFAAWSGALGDPYNVFAVIAFATLALAEWNKGPKLRRRIAQWSILLGQLEAAREAIAGGNPPAEGASGPLEAMLRGIEQLPESGTWPTPIGSRGSPPYLWLKWLPPAAVAWLGVTTTLTLIQVQRPIEQVLATILGTALAVGGFLVPFHLWERKTLRAEKDFRAKTAANVEALNEKMRGLLEG